MAWLRQGLGRQELLLCQSCRPCLTSQPGSLVSSSHPPGAPLTPHTCHTLTSVTPHYYHLSFLSLLSPLTPTHSLLSPLIPITSDFSHPFHPSLLSPLTTHTVTLIPPPSLPSYFTPHSCHLSVFTSLTLTLHSCHPLLLSLLSPITTVTCHCYHSSPQRVGISNLGAV